MPAPHMELRRSTENPPKTPGHYYGRFVGKGRDPDILPRRVSEELGYLAVMEKGFGFPLAYFEWYGPVPVCRKSGE